MGVLNTLTFTTAPKPNTDPVMRRRARLIERLEQQRQLLSDPNYHLTVQRWVKGEDGNKQLVNKHKRIKKWWRTDITGNTSLVVRYGARPLEFVAGRPAIAVGDKGKLPEVLDALIAAAQAGEVDDVLKSVGAARNDRGVPKLKAVAGKR
jgi:hypothetical protein